MEPVFVGIHDFLNPPPSIHMVDYTPLHPASLFVIFSALYVSRLVRYWFSRFFKFTAFLVPSVEPVFVGIHDFLNPPPWIHMIDYRYFIPGVANYL